MDSIHASRASASVYKGGMVRALAAGVVSASLLAPAGARVQTREPIIDMHLHASAANNQGPPPVAVCTPIDPMPGWTQLRTYAEEFLELVKKPPCKDPVWSPATDAELLQQTVDVVRRLNVYGPISSRTTKPVKIQNRNFHVKHEMHITNTEIKQN